MKAYIRKEKEEGVSPVIATILMVAITVVLAATLYLMVGNMGTGTTDQTSGNFAKTEKVDTHTYKLTFTQFSPDTGIGSLTIYVENKTATGTTTSDSLTLPSSDNGASVTGTNTHLTITYNDPANNKIINSGDYLTISGVDTGDTYTVTILDSNGNQICSTSFTPS